MALKMMHTVAVGREKEVEVKSEVKKEDGTIVVEIKKEKQNVPVTIGIRKPTRALIDDAELFYGVRLSEGVKAGMLTRAMLAKRVDNDGGAWSEPDKEKFANLYFKMYEKQNEFQRMSIKDEANKTEEEKSIFKNLVVEIAELRKEMQDFEMAQSSIFENTADNRARTKTILWWCLFLSYVKDDKGEYAPLYKGATFEEKVAEYDRLEEEGDEFYFKAIRKIAFLISSWYYGADITKVEEDILKDEEARQ